MIDAADSGMSIDNVCEIKEYLFKTILDDEKEADVYIVISANEYELARGEACFDTYNGKYIEFADYEAFRAFILDSRKIKNM